MRSLNIVRSESICSLYDGRKVENEEYVFVTCTRYIVSSVTYKVVVDNFYSLLELETYDLGCFMSNVSSYSSSALGTS